MKDLLSKIGLDSETVEKQVERENEIAFNRGAASLTTEARPIETKYQKDESEDRLTRTTHRSPIEEAGKEAFSSTSESLTHSTDEIYEADPANLDNEYTKSKFSIHNVEEPSDPTEESEEPIVVKENKLLVSTKENVHGTSGNTNKEYLPASSKDVQEKYARPGNEPQMYDQDLGAFSEKVPFDVNFKRLGNSAIREVSKMSVLFLSIFLLLV
nr:hypothetical transcript [Hymenolepis microstoma]CUU99552.1 hypothetical transcript [Hymenolepis microstoma]